MKNNLRDLTERDIRFLKNLDEQLRSTEIIEDPYARHDWQKRFVNENFHDRQISNREALRILGISRKNNVVLYPSTTQFGFATAFGMERVDLVAPEVEPITELLLRFREDQLPKGYDFERLSPYFLEDINMRTANLAGIEIKPDKVNYIY